ncbi:MAG: hypothetical protein ACQESF_06005, partial [Nanobdellota archaeon]
SFRPLLNKIDDTQCGFRAIRIDLLKKLKLKSDGFEIETEILLEAIKNKAKFNYLYIKGNYNKYSKVTKKDYLKINDFFDSWIINNKDKLEIPKRVILFVFIGQIISSFIKNMLRK